ncbi:MerR family transcriptional regulator [Chitinophagaceae bacterium MMS25-I14]
MERYTINNVEQLTGINAHSLRAWEKRYKTLVPHRTETNIRYYDDYQLRKLLNIATLQSAGHKISKLMAMKDEELHALITALPDHTPTDDEQLMAAPVNKLVAAMLAFDEPLFDKVLSGTIIRLGMFDAMLTVVYPFLRKTGILWSTENISPAQEHFASNILRRKLQSAIDGLPYPSKSDMVFLLFLPPDELHEIGLLFSDYLIRHAGKTSVYLGQNIPYTSLKTALDQTRASHLLTFFTTGTDVEKQMKQLTQIMKGSKSKLIICGSEFSPELKLPANIKLLKAPNALFDFL